MSSSKVPQSASDTALTDPVRYPVSASPPVRTKRAFVLVLLTLLVPAARNSWRATAGWAGQHCG
jgi:polyisoprenyl-teichoic acid--peptidoglycan teichoic acid transferase